MSSPVVVNLSERAGLSRTDIPAQLRALAERIESGEQPADLVAVAIIEGPDLVPPVVFGWGNTVTGLYVAGAFLAAANFIANAGACRT